MRNKKGIDVSFWNGQLTGRDFEIFKKSGVEFLIARAGGYRGTMADSTFSRNYRGAKKAGLGFGAYYYSTAMTPAQAKAEARHAVSLCRGKKFDYPVFMDVEDMSTQGRLSKGALTRVIKAFTAEIRRLGRKSGVYASYYWLTQKIGDLSGIDVWVAQYHSSNDYKGKTAMWQYSSKGRFDGISGYFDLNRCYKDYEKSEGSGEKKTYKEPLSLPARGYFKWDDRGKNVRQLQRFLNWYGEKPVIDGVYGAGTIEAVKNFQKRNSLAVDGLFGKESLARARRVKR